MTKKIHVIKERTLPLELATESIGLFGRKGSGKTYAEGKLGEGFLAAGIQCVFIDQTGKLYGLRLDASGKRKSRFDVVILGGLRGDVPLAPESGALVADLAMDTTRSFILDVSTMSKSQRQRFCADFGERLWARTKVQENPRPVHVFLEESQLIVPQMIRPDDARMYGVWEEIVRLGRNFGLGVTLISQRPQSVNKEVLSQVEVLFAFQLNGSHERKAMREWIGEKGGDLNLVDELPGLAKGEAYLWSPQLLETFERVHVDKKETYDSSATVKVGVRAVARRPKPLDMRELREAMEKVRNEGEKNDPGALRRRIAELEKEIEKMKKTKAAPPGAKFDVTRLKKQVDRLLAQEKDFLHATEMASRRLLKSQQEVVTTLNEAAAVYTQAAPALDTRLQKLSRELADQMRGPSLAQQLHDSDPRRLKAAIDNGFRDVRPSVAPNPTASIARRVDEARGAAGSNSELSKAAKAILRALFGAGGQAIRTRMSTLSGYSIRSSSFANAVSELRTAGYVTNSGDAFQITQSGENLAMTLGAIVPQTVEERQQMWLNKLDKAPRTMLGILIGAGGRPVPRAELAISSGYSISSSSFVNAISALRSNELIIVAGAGETAAYSPREELLR